MYKIKICSKKDIPNKTFADEYIGGGTIIHPSVVMTVAHKVHKSQPEQVPIYHSNIFLLTLSYNIKSTIRVPYLKRESNI